MSKLERWLPFMFKRKTQQEKQQEPQPATETQALSQPVQHHPIAPSRFSPARNARPHRSYRYDSLFESRRTTP